MSIVEESLMTAGLEPVLSHTEKSCIASYYRKFSTNINENHKTETRFVTSGLGHSGPKQCIYIKFFHLH